MSSSLNQNEQTSYRATNRASIGAIPKIIKDILNSRGIEESQFAQYLSKDLHALPALDQMQDLKKASERIILAIEQKEKIGVYGDYDVDGTTSCALLVHFFRLLGIQIETQQPGRFIEGYGLHLSSIDKAVEQKIKVLITVDCGITNNAAAQYSKEKNIDLIITDHHADISTELPPAYAVVNPNRRDEGPDSPLRALAGVGVAFSLALEIKKGLESRGKKIPTLYPLLQFVAIGTICDLAKLTPLNLILVRHGLKQLPKTQYTGLRTFLDSDELKLESLPEEKLAFSIGPLINSKGRLDHPEMALQLLLEDDSSGAFQYFSHLKICNDQRKLIQNEVFEEAKKQIISGLDFSSENVSVAFAPHWHEGVIGIVASKLVETFNRSAIVFTRAEQKGMIKASARGAKGVNIFEKLQSLNHYYLKFGGHKAAAGLTMEEQFYTSFCLDFKKLFNHGPIGVDMANDPLVLSLDSNQIHPQLHADLFLLSPYGEGNPRPLFKCADLRLESYQILKEKHVRWSFRSQNGMPLQGISFSYLDQWDVIHPREIIEAQKQESGKAHFYFHLGNNRFRGNNYLQLEVKRASLSLC